MKVLFVTKQRAGYGPVSTAQHGSWGLLNSARMVVMVLREAGVDAHIVDVFDANSIDREIHHYRPKMVVIEALWVPPEKFVELLRRYPKVHFVVRIHSKVAFLAHEGMALDYIRRYATRVRVGFNDTDTVVEFSNTLPTRVFAYLPNIYHGKARERRHREHDPAAVAISCFGAIRPLKNQLLQAMAAMVYAHQTRRKLYFHINATRTEQGGEAVLKNLRALFRDHHKAVLVEHGWKPHEDFCGAFHDIDIAMQVSLSETFNITTADAVAAGVPVVVSPEIGWVPELSQADPRLLSDMVKKLHHAETWASRAHKNLHALERWNEKALRVWLEFLSGKH